MGCLNCVQIILFLSPILINSQIETLEKKCYSITCTNYKTNNTKCDHTGHLQDPFNNECVPQCDGPCINNYCDYCVCFSTNTTAIMSAQPSECKRVMNGTYCEGDKCECRMITSCNDNYIINPYDKYECLQRCDEDSCRNGGTCSSLGYCICRLGYRPDITNPRRCVKIPEDNTIMQERTCHKGFKLSDDGKCVSACGDCQNGCCGADGVCQCWENYELDVANSTCVAKHKEEVKMICSADTCLNGVCDSRGVCQCPDCSDFINEDCQNELNSTAGDVGAKQNCENTSSSGDMVLGSTHRTTISILSCIAVILLIAAIALMIIVLRIKRALPQNEGKVKILFGSLG